MYEGGYGWCLDSKNNDMGFVGAMGSGRKNEHLNGVLAETIVDPQSDKCMFRS